MFEQISWDIRLGSWLLCRLNKENPATAFKCAFHLDGIALFQLLQGNCGWLSNYLLSSAAATSRWRRPPIILEGYLKDLENDLKIFSRSNPRTWSKVRIDQRLSPPSTSIEPLLQSYIYYIIVDETSELRDRTGFWFAFYEGHYGASVLIHIVLSGTQHRIQWSSDLHFHVVHRSFRAEQGYLWQCRCGGTGPVGRRPGSVTLGINHVCYFITSRLVACLGAPSRNCLRHLENAFLSELLRFVSNYAAKEDCDYCDWKSPRKRF